MPVGLIAEFAGVTTGSVECGTGAPAGGGVVVVETTGCWPAAAGGVTSVVTVSPLLST